MMPRKTFSSSTTASGKAALAAIGTMSAIGCVQVVDLGHVADDDFGKAFFTVAHSQSPVQGNDADKVHMLTDHIGTGNAVGTHTGQGRVGAVAGFNDTAGRRHDVAHTKDLAGVDVMDKLLHIIIGRVGQHLLRRIDLHHAAVTQNTEPGCLI